MKVSFNFLPLLIVLFFTLPTSIASQPASTNDQATNEVSVDALLQKMTAEQKIGQLLMIGILEKNMTTNLKKRLQKIKPGFLILFRKNIKTPMQTATLLYDIQTQALQNSQIQMIVAVDQEGGDVVRIPTRPNLPTALALGRSNDLESTYRIGKFVGKILDVLGIHMNLAPVLDLSDPEKISFIQTRSFGKNPVDVAKVSNEFARGVQSEGVVSTAKHFPGLGHMREDSHKTTVHNNVSKEQFFAEYLKPYQALIKENSISAIMMTHLVYPNLDPSLKPATFSPTIVDILKDKLKFSGLIITDDVEMAGAKYYKTSQERAVHAFLAGNDVLMVAWNKRSQRKAYEGLLKAYREGIITDERLNFSVKKILNLKISLKLHESEEKPKLKTILASLRDNSLQEPVNNIFKKIMSYELKRLESKKSLIDLNKVVVVSANYSFYEKFKESYKGNSKFVLIKKDFSFKEHLKKLNKSSLIVVNVAGPVSAYVANSLPQKLKEKAIILNSRFLGSIKKEEDFFGVLQISMKHTELGAYLGSYLKNSPASKLSIERSLSSSR